MPSVGRITAVLRHYKTAVAAPAHDRLCVYRNDLLMRCLNGLHVHWVVTVLIFLVFFLGGKILLNYLSGTLVSPTLYDDFRADFWVFPPFILIRWLLDVFGSIFNLAQPEFFIHPPSEVSAVPLIPYLRDYVDISVMIICAIHMALIQRQWERLSNIVGDLHRQHTLNQQGFTDTQYEEVVHDFNHWFDRKRWNILAIIASITIVAFFLWIFYRHGMYSGLAPSVADTAEWQKAAFTNWWANPQNGWALLSFNAIVWTIILYYIVLHNIVGIGLVKVCLRIRRYVTAGDYGSFFVPRPGHSDGVAGLGRLRTAMVHVYLSILAMGISLLLGYYYIPSGNVLILTPLFLLFALNPFYVAIPNLLVRYNLRRWKRTRLEELLHIEERLYATISSADQIHYHASLQQVANVGQLLITRDNYREVRDMPTNLFSMRRTVVYIVSYGISLFGFFI